MSRFRIAFLLGVIGGAALALPTCAPAQTTLFVLVQIDEALQPDQLSFSVLKTGADPLGPVLRPDPAGEVLAGEQTVRLVVSDAYAGTLDVRVEGLAAGTLIGAGATAALVKQGAETSVVVVLAQVGNACSGATCASGCCTGGLCRVNDFSACGTAGGPCNPCDAVNSDRCVDGACRCGAQTACAAGARCVSGACVCDSTTCPSGCCTDAGVCATGDTAAACGQGGTTCQTCPIGNTCSGGACSGCFATCTTGCCQGAVCVTAMDAGRCGPLGGACFTCSSVTSNACDADAGGCRCGNRSACPTGYRCAGGNCVCNLSTCTGCCSADAGQCVTSQSITACGTSGTTCRSCATGNVCAGGQCRCGTDAGAVCTSGETCTGGNCICNPATCAGCCDTAGGGATNRCLAGTSKAECGSGGVACQSCNGQFQCGDAGTCI